MFSGFRARLMALALLAVTPAFGVQFWDIWQEREVALLEGEERVAFLAQQAAERQAELLGESRALLDIVRGIPAVRNYTGPDCGSNLKSIAEARAWIENMAVSDSNGTIRCAVLPQAVGVNLKDRKYFQSALAEDRFVVSDLLLGRVSKRPTVVAALPNLQDGETVMYLATLELSWIEDVAAEVATELGGDIYVVDLNDQVVASHVQYDTHTLPRDAGKTLNSLADGPAGVAVFHAAEEDSVLFGYASIPDTTARIFIGVPYETILNSIYVQTRSGFRDLAITFVMIIVLAWVGGEVLLMGPIRRLDITTRKIAAGDYGTRAEESRGPVEFRRLGRTFNEMVSRLESLADADPLTGLANRRQLDRRLFDLWHRKPQTPIAIAMIDVDRFKPYNDAFGHLRGDQCLRELAEVMKSRARRSDDLVARYGGEEFTLVIPEMTSVQMARHCEALRQSVEDLAIEQTGNFGVVTVSIGIVSAIPSQFPDIDRAIRLADKALYAAKGAGRNRVFTYTDGSFIPASDFALSA